MLGFMPELPHTGEGPKTGTSRAVGLGSGGPEGPQARAVADWLLAFTKAMRGARVYAENNEMHQKFVDRAHDGLNRLLQGMEELSLGIREDRLLFESEVVHNDPDRQEGLPFILYRNAFRRITFTRGMSRPELLALIGALNADYGSFDFTGEDLVSTLWRLSLPHLRYVTIDALNVGRGLSGSLDLDDNDVDRIQADIEAIVATIYRNASPDEDIVAGVSIGRDDLEVLKELREEPEEEIELLDQATERAIADIPPGQLHGVQSFLQKDDRDALTRRMLDILVLILFKEQSSSAGSATIELLQQLYDSLVLAQRYVDARRLVVRLRDSAENAEDMQELHISQHLLRLFSTEGRILPVLDGFNDGYRTVPISDLVGFLRALGPNAAPVLLQGLGNLDSAAHRKIICDLIVEFGVPEVHLLEERTVDAKWFVVRDILELARHHPLEHITRLVREALDHEHPKVRAQAVRALRDYGPGMADGLVAERLNDSDAEVRIVAARVAAARRSKEVLPQFEAILKDESLGERDQRELRMLLGAFATIGQGSVVASLSALLHPSFFTRLKNGADLQIAAASALGLIPSDSARAHLRKGARSLNGRVREACRRALAQTRRSIVDPETGPRSSGPDLDVSEQLPTETMSLLESSASADVLFSVGPDGPTTVRAPLPTESSTDHPAYRTGPALPSVDVPHSGREEIPERLPPAPHLEELAAPHEGPLELDLDSADAAWLEPPTDFLSSEAAAGPKTRQDSGSAIDAFEAAYQQARAAESEESPAADRHVPDFDPMAESGVGPELRSPPSPRSEAPEKPALRPKSSADLAPEIFEYLGLTPPPPLEVPPPAPEASPVPIAMDTGSASSSSRSPPLTGRLPPMPDAGPPRARETSSPAPQEHLPPMPDASPSRAREGSSPAPQERLPRSADAGPPVPREAFSTPPRPVPAPKNILPAFHQEASPSDALPLPFSEVEGFESYDPESRSRPFEGLIRDALVNADSESEVAPPPSEGLPGSVPSREAFDGAGALDIPMEAPVLLPEAPPQPLEGAPPRFETPRGPREPHQDRFETPASRVEGPSSPRWPPPGYPPPAPSTPRSSSSAAPETAPLTPLGSEPLDPSGFGELGLPARPLQGDVEDEREDVPQGRIARGIPLEDAEGGEW